MLNNKHKKIIVITLVLLSFSVLASSADLLSLSIPAASLSLSDRERVGGFEVDITGGQIVSFPNVPRGWSLSIDNEPKDTARIGGNAIVGSAFLKANFFEDFLTIKKYDGDEPLKITIKIGTLTQISLEERQILLDINKLTLIPKK